jgi:hypothetical protein
MRDNIVGAARTPGFVGLLPPLQPIPSERPNTHRPTDDSIRVTVLRPFTTTSKPTRCPCIDDSPSCRTLCNRAKASRVRSYRVTNQPIPLSR